MRPEAVKPVEDLNEVERFLFSLIPSAVKALAGSLTLPDKEADFFRYRYIERLPYNSIADKLYSYEREVARLRSRVLLSCRRQFFS
jgi:DNA-directed RNA polymerase specialized sigma24 family protein